MSNLSNNLLNTLVIHHSEFQLSSKSPQMDTREYAYARSWKGVEAVHSLALHKGSHAPLMTFLDRLPLNFTSLPIHFVFVACLVLLSEV